MRTSCHEFRYPTMAANFTTETLSFEGKKKTIPFSCHNSIVSSATRALLAHGHNGCGKLDVSFAARNVRAVTAVLETHCRSAASDRILFRNLGSGELADKRRGHSEESATTLLEPDTSVLQTRCLSTSLKSISDLV